MYSADGDAGVSTADVFTDADPATTVPHMNGKLT